YLSLPPRGIRLLKVVSAQKPREIAARVLDRAMGGARPHRGAPKESTQFSSDTRLSTLEPTLSSRGGFIEDFMEDALSGNRLSPADRRLCQELVYGVIRWMATLDFLIGQKTGGRTQKAPLRNLLCLGL